ncbi:MAG: HIT domain-containing protein [Phenylobacterium sp.]|uniref:HIT domain-containing protein n=1 Tax=Phenylobacterium sp. TaxID=1871053 RepID=UPI00271E9D46|nr:HIT domain-containing protein [Phenylobacterium sp.]MDO8901797.1 HIT domain-containing protein [Phenylobacterium sp.]
MFVLDPAFVATSHPLADLPLCAARLQDDAGYPWIVLIPRVSGARELEDLSAGDQTRLMAEILAAGRGVRAAGEALGRPVEKLNVGALGNVTPQLHIHVVGRRSDDPAWPDPVWGRGGGRAYGAAELARALAAASPALGLGPQAAAR